jgi:hydrogenase maturation protease
MKTLILGLGNPLLGDDGVGWRVADEIQRQLENPKSKIENSQSLEVDCLAGGGLSLMERLVGYDRVILADAMSTGQAPPGRVSDCDLEELPDPAAGHVSSAHDTSLKTALQLGRKLGLPLPDKVLVVAIESRRVDEFSEELTPAVAEAVREAVQRIIDILGAEPFAAK